MTYEIENGGDHLTITIDKEMAEAIKLHYDFAKGSIPKEVVEAGLFEFTPHGDAKIFLHSLGMMSQVIS